MLLIGFLVPPLIDLINRWVKDSTMRFWISTGICIVIGIVINIVMHSGLLGYAGMSWSDIASSLVTSSMAIIGMANITYQSVWEDSGLRTSLGLNAKTN